MNIDRLRFRFWDEHHKCFWTTYLINRNGVIRGVVKDGKLFEFSLEDGVIEQCIGIKDCNDKLIYEGDILLVAGKYLKEVVWQAGGFGVLNYPLSDDRDIELYCGISRFDNHNIDIIRKSKIVGNIHENPELLENIKNEYR